MLFIIIQEALVKIAKALKKNNVAVDIVAFGEDNEEVLHAFHEAVNNGNSRMMKVPVGKSLDDYVISGLIHGTDLDDDVGAGVVGAGSGGGGGGDSHPFAEYGGVDPNLDPELAMVLRMSLEEERARQAQAAQSAAPASDTPAAPAAADNLTTPRPTAAAAATPLAPGPNAAIGLDEMELDDDALLQQALAMSLVEADEAALHSSTPDATTAAANKTGGGTTPPPAGVETTMFDAEDEELRKALAMSMDDEENEDKDEKS